MNGAVVKKTQETLGKVIKKPPLTEKLLSKPPFRYLHDIVSEVIRTTGFMKGLYEEAEMKSDNVKDKDSKIAFLQKAIDVVMLVSGEPVAAKPARIVAGHEPEKTNELLQTIAKCCLNKLSSDEAVRHVLAGDKMDLKGKASTSKSQGKENREEKIKGNGVNAEQKDPDRTKDEESRRKTEKPRERDRTKERDRDKDKSRDMDKEKAPDKSKDQEKEKTREKDRDRTKDKERERNRERDSHKERERVRDKDRERERDKRRERGRELQKETEERKKEKGEKKLNSSLRIPRPSSAKGQRRRPKSGAPDDSDSDGAGENATVDKPVHLENGEASDATAPHASHSASSSRRISRPSSARPAPPRVRRQESYTDAGPTERLGSAKPASAVIIDGKKLSEDEDDDDGQFVVEEAGPLSTDMPELEMGPSVDLQGDENHGGLVKKILETKKDYESSPSALMAKDQDRMPMLEAARKKERELVLKEIERLRTSVQSVCRSALPLGKIMDYIQEDMDSMQNELQNWRRENKEHAEALLQEQRITDSAVKPLKAELAELEQLIVEQQDKICAIKSNILQNEEKIRKMVSSINISKT
ncbi:TRAF3-interacting protein 1 [Bagarius yarrelli]|uniref:TRAF3-interacting protein 1 n=1 Tax=Bagarius yarrelli TaxID=175774 RepID=A0A556TW75_BAGYA|nr:TRAF3-interacting protein 1 [Bagarius yarrelli]